LRRTLYDLLPRDERPTSDWLLGRFLEYVEEIGLELYPAQESAILELFEDRNVILNTPTGSGKSLVAAALHFQALARGRRSVYTCPIKALVNEKWLALCKEFGPQNVGLSTGDATVNRDAPILCCTAEILANIALHEGDAAQVHDVVMDEFHYYSDRDRGVAWQVPLLTLPKSRFLLISATLGDTAFFEDELKRRTGRETVTVKSTDRPVPLEFDYAETSLSQTLQNLVDQGRTPVYIVHFTQAEAAQSAQDFTSINVCTREEKAEISQAIEGFKFHSPHGPDVKKWLKHGIGIHHAGLLPKYRILVEQLAQKGLLRVICGTDTLGVGVNVPIRTVLFTKLCKYDGEKTRILSARDFHQISGRAGRKGFDDLGWVVAQAPEHVVENLQLARKAAEKGKKFTKRKPPEHNFINWEKSTFERLIQAAPEQLVSRFEVSHGMLLNVMSRPEDGCRVMRQLIRDCHESPKAKKALQRRAWQLFRSLVERRIIEFIPPTESGAKLQVNLELQDDFSMNQSLSLYLLETLPLLDKEAPDYALDVVTLAESILEDPIQILRRQLDKLKAKLVSQLKAEGVEYEERMERLEELEHPKPRREFVYSTFNAFSDRHPWVGQENIRPKSIAREMFETFRSFSDYVRDYDLQRSEGLLLRHLSGVHKVLSQTVPESAKTDAVRDYEVYLRAMLRQVDSSLLDEWEKLKNPDYVADQSEAEIKPPVAGEEKPDITRDEKAFLGSIRARIFLFLRTWAEGDCDLALDALDSVEDVEGQGWTADRLGQAWTLYRQDHEHLLFDPEARNLRHTHVKKEDREPYWLVDQMLVDPEGHNDWAASFKIDLSLSREREEPVIQLLGLGAL
jgi:superfamily II RNA helicase